MDIVRRVLAMMPAAVNKCRSSLSPYHVAMMTRIQVSLAWISCRALSHVYSMPNYDCAQEWLTGLKAQL